MTLMTPFTTNTSKTSSLLSGNDFFVIIGATAAALIFIVMLIIILVKKSKKKKEAKNVSLDQAAAYPSADMTMQTGFPQMPEQFPVYPQQSAQSSGPSWGTPSSWNEPKNEPQTQANSLSNTGSGENSGDSFFMDDPYATGEEYGFSEPKVEKNDVKPAENDHAPEPYVPEPYKPEVYTPEPYSYSTSSWGNSQPASFVDERYIPDDEFYGVQEEKPAEKSDPNSEPKKIPEKEEDTSAPIAKEGSVTSAEIKLFTEKIDEKLAGVDSKMNELSDMMSSLTRAIFVLSGSISDLKAAQQEPSVQVVATEEKSAEEKEEKTAVSVEEKQEEEKPKTKRGRRQKDAEIPAAAEEPAEK